MFEIDEQGVQLIQVAVRIRPMNRQEAEKDDKRIIQVEDSTTVSLANPDDPTDIRIFGFSHCYWSYDGFNELQDGHLVADLKHPNGSKYCDQKKIFENFGKEIVQNTWSGYNTSLLSYGSSGSGKSWSMLGNGINRGIIPQIATEFFKCLREKEKGSQQINDVKLTMMEIYEGKLRDLLLGSNTKYKHTIKIREHPKRGFYVEGLRSIVVSSAEEFQIRLDEGMLSRAITTTSFNLISHKATVIVSLSLVQRYRNSKGDELTMSSVIDFYDLAGSESSKSESCSKGATHVRHKSPSNLKAFVSGIVQSSNTNRVNIPCMHSSVNKLLQNAFAGNSKTYVIAALSPCDSSFKESEATFIFCDQLQRLKTNPIVNEEMTNKLTRELKTENDNLKKMLTTGDFDQNDFFAWSDRLESLSVDKEEFRKQIIEDIKSQIKENEKEIKTLTQSQDEKIKLAKLDKPNDTIQAAKKLETERKHKPYIYNLNSDSQLTGRLVHMLPLGSTEFGSMKGKDAFISISGPGIREQHGVFMSNTKDNKTTIKPNGPDCIILVNGQHILFESPLFQNDRIVLGGSQMWIFQNPREPWIDKKSLSRLHFQFAQEEIALRSAFYMYLVENGSAPTVNLKNEIVQLTSLVEDANAMSEDLEKQAHYELALIKEVNQMLSKPKPYDDDIDNEEEDFSTGHLMIKLVNHQEDMEFLWVKSTFLERYEKMKIIFVQIQEEGLINEIDMIMDPFLEDIDTEVPIGYGLVSLKTIAYLVDLQQNVHILDYISLKPVGKLKIDITSCNEYFEDLEDTQIFLKSTKQMLGKPIYFTFKLGSSENFPSKYKDIICKYKFNKEPVTSTGKLDSKSSYALGSVFKYERRFSIDKVTPQLLDYLEKEMLLLTFYGKQRPKKIRNLFKSEYNYGNSETSFYLGEEQKQVADLAVFKKSEARLKQKLKTLESIIEETEALAQSTVPIDYLRKIINAPDNETALQTLVAYKDEFKPAEDVAPVKKLTTYQKVSEVCCLM